MKSGTSSGSSSSPTGWSVPTSWLAVWSGDDADRPGATAALGERRRRRPGRQPVDADLDAARAPQRDGVQDRGVLDRGVDDHVAAGASPRTQAEQAAVDGVGAASGEGDLVGAHAEALGDGRAGVVEQQPGVRPGPWSRRGSAYPWSSAASRTSRAAGCSGSDEAASRSTAGRRRPAGSAPDALLTRRT